MKMQRFESLEQYRNIISDFRKRNKGLVRNGYYMFDEADNLINHGRLYYILDNEALLVFRDEGKYYQVNFMVVKDFQGMIISVDKPCTAGIINSGDEESPQMIECRKTAEKLGFSFVHCNRMYEVDVKDRLICLKDEYENLLRGLNQAGLEQRQYEECFFPGVKELWETYLDVFNIPGEDWDIYIKNSILIVNTRSDNELCGVVMPKPFSNNNICHIVVEPRYWEKKLNIVLHYSALKALSERGFQTANLWIADDNIFSIKSQRKYFNIKDTGIKSYQYVLQEVTFNDSEGDI